MLYSIDFKKYNLNFVVENNTVFFESGKFGSINIEKSELLSAVILDTKTNTERIIGIDTAWQKISINKYTNSIEMFLQNPDGIIDLLFVIKCEFDENGIKWQIETINDNSSVSVMSVNYPTPVITAQNFDFFVPITCGVEIQNAGIKGYYCKSLYPYHQCCMQYFAMYSNGSGIYLGVEDPTASVKEFEMTAGDNTATVKALFFGINGTKPGNSFAVPGICKWEFLDGDWYDATLKYADFVKNKTDWLPLMDENGRVDTEEKYKKVPFWVTDYIPNSKTQGDNKPMKLSAGSDLYEKDYWVNAVIELKKQLDVPIAYHIYNWHKIPFNIEYPHFLPAKTEFIEGVKKLRENGVYIMPYINAVSWETRDAEMGHETNFENTGIDGAVINSKGEIFAENYPQVTKSGHTSMLAPMCPSFNKWHSIIEKLARDMELTLDIDGIYFDEISAHPSRPCYNSKHNHPLGGGSYWVDGYKFMMDRIKANKPKGAYYFSECNAEPYANSFDGFLTWMWICNGQVPAFSVIYAGYIQLIGRSTLGQKKDDIEFFKYMTAQSLLYGQQIGWCKADVVYNSKMTAFLKRIVKTRQKYWELFANGQMLRQPIVSSSLKDKITGPGLDYKDDIVMPQVIASAWKYRNDGKVVLFIINISDEKADFTVSIKYKEYGIDNLPDGFDKKGETAEYTSFINPATCLEIKF